MAALGVTSASAARPTGPAATLASTPSVTFPPFEKARTARSLLSTITKSVTCAPICGPHPAPPVPMNDGPDQPCSVRATTTPSPAFPLKMKPALTTLIIAKPRARRRTREGMPLSGIWRNSRIVTAERSTVSCSVAFAAISDKEESVRMRNNLFIGVQVLRPQRAVWTCLFDEDVDLSRSSGEAADYGIG